MKKEMRREYLCLVAFMVVFCSLFLIISGIQGGMMTMELVYDVLMLLVFVIIWFVQKDIREVKKIIEDSERVVEDSRKMIEDINVRLDINKLKY
jgi:arginine exporter protein ArgO